MHTTHPLLPLPLLSAGASGGAAPGSAPLVPGWGSAALSARSVVLSGSALPCDAKRRNGLLRKDAPLLPLCRARLHRLCAALQPLKTGYQAVGAHGI
jgi:hypothetical protein